MRRILLAAAGFLFVAPAQAQIGFAPLVGYDFDYEAPTVGLAFELPLTPGILPLQASIRPSAEYIFVDSDGASAFRVAGDLIGRFRAPGVPFAPYGKAGVVVERISVDVGSESDSNTEIGLGIGAGAAFDRFFVEGTIGIGDISNSRIAVGYQF